MTAENSLLIPESTLLQYSVNMLSRVGVPADEAELVASNLIEADLRGVASHGIVRLPIYIKRILDGGTNPTPKVNIVRQTRTTAVVDGDNGLGHFVGVKAMEIAIEKAAEGDVSFVAVRNSNHFGTAAYYAEMAARKGMIGFSFTIGAINHMAPWGGAEAMLGNNPFAIAFPSREPFPVVLDMACSVAARGKIIVAAKEGKPIPSDWATGPDGLPTTDAAEALKGFVIPVGGPKGYALTLTVGLLSTMLSGAAFGRDVGELYEKTADAQNSGHLFGVLPVSSFDDLESYLDRMDRAIADLRNAKKATGVDRIYMPGEREYLALIKHRENGVPIGPALARELAELGRKHDVDFEVSL
ncbi:malate/L-lactate dehydrogenase [Caballeronia glebae]|uniref:Malate/L-lactate dehydrogenase n=1 Tax=Caballeronia glebae TaxID=1777143 RepID=A0A158AZ07_9BURK|nr:Ldh family oxidoreductase [Caballeronia glebae]SAK62949.1 malate/L-lactate dehydrogenase [Caballeronia glebae]